MQWLIRIMLKLPIRSILLSKNEKRSIRVCRDDCMDMMYVEDCCEILDSMRVPITASDREEGEYPYYGANGIQDHVADYIFDDELVLLAEDGGNFGSKERPIAYRVSGKCWVNNHAHVLKPKAGLDVDYLCYSLMFYKVDGMVNGATRQKLTQAAMRKMKIPSRSMNEQLHIVDELNRILKIKEQRQQELTLLDDLIKARFVELFGLPVSNTKGWKTEQMGEVAPAINYKGEFDDEVWLLNLDMVEAQTGRILDYLVVSEEEVGNSTCTFDTSNVLYSKLRPYLNKVVIPDRCGYATSELVPLQPVKTKINREYLAFMLRSDEFVNMINEKVAGAKMPRVPMGDFRKFDVPVPPMELQEQFADFAHQVNKSKFDTMTFAPIYAIINLYLHTHFYQGRR